VWANINIVGYHGLYGPAHTGGYLARYDPAVHELSVCQALLTQVDEIARREQAESVSCVTIEMGPLCGIEPNLLRAAFTVLRSSGVAAGADLVFETPGVSVICLACGVRSETIVNRLVCGECGGYRTRVVGGEELRLLRVAMSVTRPLVES
jgi:hydrogenase nickel incorporation protein HypA/HybF